MPMRSSHRPRLAVVVPQGATVLGTRCGYSMNSGHLPGLLVDPPAGEHIAGAIIELQDVTLVSEAGANSQDVAVVIDDPDRAISRGSNVADDLPGAKAFVIIRRIIEARRRWR